MAANWRTSTSAIKQYAARIHLVPQALQDAAADRINKTATETARRLRSAVPLSEEAPHIRDSVEVVDGKTLMKEKIIRIGNSALVYAAPLEFGHMAKGKHVPANPFFFPVVRIMNKKHRNGMRYALRKVLKQMRGMP